MTPSELLNLMESSIIKTGSLQNSSTYGRPEMLALTPETFFKGVNKEGKSIPIYNLKKAKTPGVGFNSYICDYQKSEIHYQVLSNEADFCFTITMNGCTFGIGAANNEGDVLVSHANQASVVDGVGVPTGNQYEKQFALSQTLHGSTGTYLTPDQYYPTGRENITTFGIRIQGKWNFFYQSYKAAGGGKMELLGLFPFKTNMLTG